MARFTNGTTVIDTDVPSERIELRAQGFKEETAAELEARTVPELKSELKSAGLPTDGNKADLVERLAAPTEKAPAGKSAPAKS